MDKKLLDDIDNTGKYVIVCQNRIILDGYKSFWTGSISFRQVQIILNRSKL